MRTLVSDSAGLHPAGTTGLRLPECGPAAFHRLRLAFRDGDGALITPVQDRRAQFVLTLLFDDETSVRSVSDNYIAPWLTHPDGTVETPSFQDDLDGRSGQVRWTLAALQSNSAHEVHMASGTAVLAPGGAAARTIPMTIQYSQAPSGVPGRAASDWFSFVLDVHALPDFGGLVLVAAQHYGCTITDVSGTEATFSDAFEKNRRLYVPLAEGGWTHATMTLRCLVTSGGPLSIRLGYAHEVAQGLDVVEPQHPLVFTRSFDVAADMDVTISTRAGTNAGSATTGFDTYQATPNEVIGCPELAACRYLVVEWSRPNEGVGGHYVRPFINRSR